VLLPLSGKQGVVTFILVKMMTLLHKLPTIDDCLLKKDGRHLIVCDEMNFNKRETM